VLDGAQPHARLAAVLDDAEARLVVHGAGRAGPVAALSSAARDGLDAGIGEWLHRERITLPHFPASAFRHFASGLTTGAFPDVRALTVSSAISRRSGPRCSGSTRWASRTISSRRDVPLHDEGGHRRHGRSPQEHGQREVDSEVGAHSVAEPGGQQRMPAEIALVGGPPPPARSGGRWRGPSR
jgi:hypothetical protein